MKSSGIEEDFVVEGKEISLSNQVITELLKVTLERRLPFRFKVKGFSMTPFIKDGDVVTIYPLSNATVTLGMCVAFISESGRLAIHRIIGRRAGLYIIKGDNSSMIDGYFTQENILGYVSVIERNSKNFYPGLGREREVIAVLSRMRLLGLMRFVWRLIPRKIRKPLKLF